MGVGRARNLELKVLCSSLILPLKRCVCLGSSYKHSEPQFFHLENGNNPINSTCFHRVIDSSHAVSR